MTDERTLSAITASGDRAGGRESGAPRAQLVFLLQCDRTESISSRHLLDGVTEVEIGRGDRQSAERRDGPAGGVLTLGLPDRRLSRRHARLVCLSGRWQIEDLGSKNGSLLNGSSVGRKSLDDGDVIECGHSFLLFRDEAPPAWGDQPDLDASRTPVPAPNLRTFAGALAGIVAALPRVAEATVPVMIRGETGTGKEVVARAIHELSRRDGRFVGVNCGALAGSIMEAELFGHRRGAFSGATDDRLGLVRQADRGTLLLDEVGELHPQAQAALLRVLQEREVIPVGDSRPVPVDARLITATHRDLEELVAEGRFREDLFARISGVLFRLPALRERREDLGLLIGDLLDRLGLPRRPTFSAAAARLILGHEWPHNVRELERCLQSATLLAGAGPIQPQHLPEALRRSPPAVDLSDDERRHRDELLELLAKHDGNVAAVARALGKGRMQIHRWAKRYGIALDSLRR